MSVSAISYSSVNPPLVPLPQHQTNTWKGCIRRYLFQVVETAAFWCAGRAPRAVPLTTLILVLTSHTFQTVDSIRRMIMAWLDTNSDKQWI